MSSFLHAKVRSRSRTLPPTPTLSTATHVSPIRRDKGTRETAELKNRETMREDTCRFLRGQMARPLIIRDETRPVIARPFQLKPVGSAENLDENNVIAEVWINLGGDFLASA